MKQHADYYLRLVISGGQTGADQSGLFAAEAASVPTGGYAPRKWRTDAGPAPWLGTRFGLQEFSPGYPARTEANVARADGTLLLGRLDSAGTQLTERLCRKWRRSMLHVPWPPSEPEPLYAVQERVAQWLCTHRIEVLNVAGNRERMNPGITLAGIELLTAVFRDLGGEA